MKHDTDRVEHHPILGEPAPSDEITFSFNGEELVARKGDVIATALLVNGVRRIRASERGGSPRGLYCAIGHCFECQVVVDGKPGVRACLTPVYHGMEVTMRDAVTRAEDTARES